MSRSIGRRPRGPAVVALGGGHGLSASLKALRRITEHITAVVGVADDGGSSGRLRKEFGTLPPGDLRMALAALCSDDTWGRTWSEVIQHRFGGHGDLAGHSLGNLLIAALWDQTHDAVIGLDWLGALLEAQGRVLPCSSVPLEIVADVVGLDPSRPDRVSVVRGQVAVAATAGQVVRLALEPDAPPPCPEALEAIAAADAIVLGPGSWFTSVLPHVLIPAQLEAISHAKAQRILVMNLAPQRDAETAGVSASAQIQILRELAPELRLDTLVVDPRHVEDIDQLSAVAGGAEVVSASLAFTNPAQSGYHDPDRLAVAFGSALETLR